MHVKYLLTLIIAFAFISCKKEKTAMVPEVPGQKIPLVLLKDITIPSLPSPYYYFEYDMKGKVSFVSYASGFFMYDFL